MLCDSTDLLSKTSIDMSEIDFDDRLEKLEEQIRKINERNEKVQKDKAWETSNFRVISVCVVTWVVISLVFWTIGVDNPIVNAIIPTTGFYLSTQSLPFLKKWWLERQHKK